MTVETTWTKTTTLTNTNTNTNTNANHNSKTALPAAVLPAGRYRLDPELTTIGFTAKKFGLFTIRGCLALTQGTFTVTTPVEHSSLHAVLAADTFHTPMAKRDEHVKGPGLLDVTSYPTIQFDSTELIATRTGWEARGLLTVHGTVGPVALAISGASQEGGLVRVTATALVDRRRFGVTGMRAAASSMIGVTIDAVATRIGTTPDPVSPDRRP
jgi:polyisoprenoid-binding protein YceI